MNSEMLKEQLLQTGWELMQAKSSIAKLQARYDELFASAQKVEAQQIRITAVERVVEPHKSKTKKTDLVLMALPKDGSAIDLQALSSMVGAPARLVSATCSNLQRKGRVESAGRGMWKLVKAA